MLFWPTALTLSGSNAFAMSEGYHDAVLTETPLRVLVTGGNVALDMTFGCTVLSRDDEVLDYLDQLT